jgi:hypothetical protein
MPSCLFLPLPPPERRRICRFPLLDWRMLHKWILQSLRFIMLGTWTYAYDRTFTVWEYFCWPPEEERMAVLKRRFLNNSNKAYYVFPSHSLVNFVFFQISREGNRCPTSPTPTPCQHPWRAVAWIVLGCTERELWLQYSSLGIFFTSWGTSCFWRIRLSSLYLVTGNFGYRYRNQ